MEDNALRWEVLTQYHDHPLTGHPGIFKTYLLVSQDYWWPDLKQFVKNYVKGCAMCQMTESCTHKLKIPIFPITTERNSTPFEMVAMDLIVDLPRSNNYNSILTITNHDCTKVALFLPCSQTIDASGITQLYAQHVFPHYRAPKKAISDRDPRFTATFVKELCQMLGITQNLSTAYHPQTDGQSERTNQWLEQYLQIYGNHQQNNWADWLPMAQYVYNSWPSATTGKTPFELLMGHMPTLPDQSMPTDVPSLEDRQSTLEHVREQAQ